MAYNLVVDGAITNAQINNGQLEFNPNGTFSKYFKIFGSITNIALDSDGYFIVSPNGTFADYAIIGDRLTDVPLTSTGAIINPTRLYKYFRPFSNLTTYQNPGDYLVRYKLDGTDSLTWVTAYDGRIGKASPDAMSAYFDGTNKATKNTDSSILAVGTSAFSVSFWFNTIKMSQSAVFNVGSPITLNGYEIRISGVGAVRFRCNSVLQDSAGSFNDGKWHFAVCTLSGSGGTLNFYVDNTFQGSVVAEAYNITDQNDVEIGDGTTSRFDGMIDDLRVYNRVLSSGEITALYNYTNDWNETHSTAFDVFNSRRYDTITESLGNMSAWAGIKGNTTLLQGVGTQQPDWVSGVVQMVGANSDNMVGNSNVGINGDFTIFEIVSYSDITEAINTLATTDGSYLRKNTTGNSRNAWATTSDNSTYAFTNGVIGVVANRVQSGVRAEGWTNGSLDKTFSDNTNLRTNNTPIKMNNSAFAQTVNVYGYWIFQSYISDSELDKVFGLIHWQLGLQSLLPSDHPYKNNPPRI